MNDIEVIAMLLICLVYAAIVYSYVESEDEKIYMSCYKVNTINSCVRSYLRECK